MGIALYGKLARNLRYAGTGTGTGTATGAATGAGTGTGKCDWDTSSGRRPGDIQASISNFGRSPTKQERKSPRLAGKV